MVQGFPLGILTQKFGERWVAVAGAVLLAIGMFCSMFATKMTTIYITYGLIAGLGSGTIHYCGNTVIGPHFNAKWRPIAMTVANAGIPLSTLIFPPVMTKMIEHLDWEKTFMFLGLLSLLGIPSGLAFFSPEKTVVEAIGHLNIDVPINIKMALLKLLKNTNYILFVTTSFVIFFGMFIPATFFPDLMYEAGRSSTDIYVAVMIMGCTNFFGRLLFGAAAYKLPRYLPFLHSFGMMLFGIGAAMLTLASSFLTFSLLAAILGIGTGGVNGLHCVMAAHVVPINELRLAYGMVLFFGGIPLLFGMPIAGLITDMYGHQRSAFIFTACLYALGALITCIIGFRDVCDHKKSNGFEESYTMQSGECQ